MVKPNRGLGFWADCWLEATIRVGSTTSYDHRVKESRSPVAVDGIAMAQALGFDGVRG